MTITIHIPHTVPDGALEAIEHLIQCRVMCDPDLNGADIEIDRTHDRSVWINGPESLATMGLYLAIKTIIEETELCDDC